jgi:hypothetical protein
MAATEVRVKEIMGIQPWAPVIRDPSINFEEILHGLKSFIHMVQLALFLGVAFQLL